MMKRAGIAVFAGLVLCSWGVSAARLESLSLGFHVIPSVERVEDRRVLDLTLSFGGTLRLDADNSIDLMVMMDSAPSSLGTSAQFNYQITDPFEAGFGITVLWPFSEDLILQWPILGTYAHAAGRTHFASASWAEAAVSFPLLTLANQLDGWTLLPLAELPTVFLSADIRLAEQASIQPRLTFQPVIIDTTVLDHPLGRVSDDLLILTMGSIYLQYLP
jgi:hypothetical protein